MFEGKEKKSLVKKLETSPKDVDDVELKNPLVWPASKARTIQHQLMHSNNYGRRTEGPLTTRGEMLLSSIDGLREEKGC